MEKKGWYAIRAAQNSKTAEISIYDDIGGWGVSARSFIAELNSLEAENITLRIHSPGGSIVEGNAIYNALVRHPAKINVSIDGLAASMASVIACAGDTVTMASNGLFMIHNPWTYASGEAEELRKTADLLDKMKENIVGAYQKRSGLGKKVLGEMMDAETWMTADEAKENGFIDAIGEKIAASNSYDLSKFKNFEAAQARWPDGVRATWLTSETEDVTPEERTLLQKVADFFKSDKTKDERISELEAVIAKNDEATEELVTAHATAILAKEATITAKDQEITELKAKVVPEADFEARVNTEVTRRCAAIGIHEPIKRDPELDTDGDLESIRIRMNECTDPKERADLARKARELRSKARA